MSQFTPRETPRAGLNGDTPHHANGAALDLCSPDEALLSDTEETRQLRLDNAALRRRLEEMEGLLAELTGAGAGWEERQRDYEALLEEKSEVIRSLHQRLAELREAVAAGPIEPAGAGEDPAAAAERQELLALKRELEEEREQLNQDEQALMQQMRQMEMTMSRERAELARQRSEIQRLHAELRHEIDQAARDSSLRERLAPLQRRQQDAARGRTPGAAPNGAPPTQQAGPADPQEKKTSGLFRRLFGG